ncbi:MAG: NAD(P)-dependent oxidoreductase [Lachnospiraceae bacterium]|nr:NAD(P)-dependent oxidoreductase [Lachnospiraceae bacterium]
MKNDVQGGTSAKKTVLITGASGFLGRHLAEKYRENGNYRVYAFTSSPEKLSEHLAAPGVTVLHRVAVFGDEMRDVMRGSVLINCAFPRNADGPGMAEGLKYIRRVFEKAALFGAEAVVDISSQSVYSQKRTGPADESEPVCPENSYAVAKYAVEEMLEGICGNKGPAVCHVRMASLIGPAFDQRIVNRLVMQALKTGGISVKRNSQYFGFFDVDDAAAALFSMTGCDRRSWKRYYNLGGRNVYTLTDIADAVKDVLHGIRDVMTEITDGPGECNTGVNAELFYRDFGFEPQIDLRESTRRIAEAAMAAAE